MINLPVINYHKKENCRL